jgi:hypothetical protein
MKIILLPALLLALAPRAEIRVEADGVRLGAELVTAPALSLKEAGKQPVLVSRSAVESLSSALSVEVAGRGLLLEPGVRLSRTGENYVLSTHGPALLLSAGGKTLRSEKSAEFRVTDKGFDFGALGALEGEVAAKAEAGAPQVVPPPRQDPVSPERRAIEAQQLRGTRFRRRTEGPGDPTIGNTAALLKEFLFTAPQLSPFGN